MCHSSAGGMPTRACLPISPPYNVYYTPSQPSRHLAGVQAQANGTAVTGNATRVVAWPSRWGSGVAGLGAEGSGFSICDSERRWLALHRPVSTGVLCYMSLFKLL